VLVLCPFFICVGHVRLLKVLLDEVEGEQRLAEEEDLVAGEDRLMYELEREDKLGAVLQVVGLVVVDEAVGPVRVEASCMATLGLVAERVEAGRGVGVVGVELGGRGGLGDAGGLGLLVFEWDVGQVEIDVGGLVDDVFVENVRVVPYLWVE